jgi:hypothetical protein
MKRKEAVFKGLDLINVFFEDTSLNSPDVFQITEFPTQLTGGKNLIKLKGHPDNLRIGSYLNIEVLDYNGDPIYHEIIDYLDEDKSRIISIYVYEETSAGEAIVILTAELKQINGQLVPQEWEGITNVRWSRTIQVNPTLSNKSEIIFENVPEVTLIEQIGVQLDRVYPNDTQYPTYSTGTVKYFSYNSQPAIEILGGVFSKEMENGTITVATPINPLPTPQYTLSNTEYSSTIKKVLNDTTILLDSEFVAASSQSLSLHLYTSFDYSAYTLNYEAAPTYIPTENSESFAFFDIVGLEPATGDIDRIKIFLNGAGSIGTWEQINDIELIEQELLIDTSSVYPDFKIGEFTSQSIIDNYWEAHYYSGFSESTPPTLTFITSSIGQGVQIVPELGHNLSAYNQIYTFQTQNEYTATFVSQSAYKITIDAIGTRSSISGNDNPRLSVFLSGSAFPYDATDILNQEFSVKLGRRIGQIEVTSNSQRFDDYIFEFESPETGTANLIFVVESGEWQLSDIRTTTDNAAGYTPGYARIRTEIPTKHKSNAQYAFRIEYYNIAGVKSRQTSLISNINWGGGNRYIDGDYSMLTGSLYVADSLESGIAISGYADTGFVRSLGYSGFEYGDPGFLLWSGSALSGSSGTKGGAPYSGVGLELYANEDNYFRYSTTDSELDIRTETFFVGNATTYISASNGNLDIQSPNFFLGNATTYVSGSNGNLRIQAGTKLDINNGVISGSAINITTTILGEDYTVLDTTEKIIDASNIGRTLYLNNSTLDYLTQTATINQTGSNTTIATFYAFILPGETTLTTMYTVSGSRTAGTATFWHDILDLSPEFISGSAGVVSSQRIRIPIDTIQPYVYSGSLTLPASGVTNPTFGTYFSSLESGLASGGSNMYRFYRYTDISHLAGQMVKFTFKRYPYVVGGSGTATANISYRDITILSSRSGLIKANSAIQEVGGLQT